MVFLSWTLIAFLLGLFWGGLVFLFFHNSFWAFIAVLVVFAIVYIVWGFCDRFRAMEEIVSGQGRQL